MLAVGRGWEAMEQGHSASSNSSTAGQGAVAESTTPGGHDRSQWAGLGRGWNVAGWSKARNEVSWNRAAKAGKKGSGRR